MSSKDVRSVGKPVLVDPEYLARGLEAARDAQRRQGETVEDGFLTVAQWHEASEKQGEKTARRTTQERLSAGVTTGAFERKPFTIRTGPSKSLRRVAHYKFVGKK